MVGGLSAARPAAPPGAGILTASPDPAARPLRLLLFYDCLYPESVGGIEHRNAELARALAERGHRVTLAAFTATPRHEERGVEVLPLGRPAPAHGAARRGARDALRLAAAARRIDLAPYDVVETASTPYAHLFPLALRCRRHRRPLLVSWHEYWGDYWRGVGGALWRGLAAAEWVAAQLGTAALAVSELTATRLRARRWRGETVVLPNGVPLADIRAAAGAASPGGPPLISAGRLRADKRLDLLLAALARLAPRHPGPLLTLIGDGPERGRLEEQARALGIAAQVQFRGRLETSREVWRELGRARIAVQPSAREGFGLFAVEAMAAGLPVVYCESPDSATGELVRDRREGLATPADPAALAQALDRLLADPAERDRLGAGARERAAEFDWAPRAARLESLLLALARRS